MKKPSQKETVEQILNTRGVISNVEAIMDYHILRLGAIICDLRNEGLNIKTDYENKTGKRNTHYRLIPKETLF